MFEEKPEGENEPLEPNANHINNSPSYTKQGDKVTVWTIIKIHKRSCSYLGFNISMCYDALCSEMHNKHFILLKDF